MLKEAHPDAEILSHPECRGEILEISDYIGSTSGIIRHVCESAAKEFIICTEEGVSYKIGKENPDKKFYFPQTIPVCPNMKKNTLEKIAYALRDGVNEVQVEDELRNAAVKPLEKMLELAR